MTYQDDAITYDVMVDLAAGRLTGPEADRLRTRIDAEPALAQDYAVVAMLTHDLESYGDSFTAGVPPIDIVEDVLARVSSLGPGASKILPFTPRQPARTRVAKWAVAVAVAAAVFVAVWIGVTRPEQAPVRDIARDIPAPGEPVFDAVNPPDLNPGRVAIIGRNADEADPDSENAPVAPPSAASPGQLAKHDISVDDIVKERQAVGRDQNARDVLARWAALAPEQAKAVLEQPGASTDAIVGAALALGGADAVPYLQDAVSRNPEDAFLNLELAKATGGAPKPELDDENALGWYVYARQLLSSDPPNLPEALKALGAAQNYSKAHAYTLEAAAYHEEALIASGMPADSAHMVTAFTAGPSEYEDMVTLGNDLLAYAQYFQELGNTEAAQIITESVQRFGQQLDQGALFSHERFAGLELQDSALQVLETMYSGAQMESLARNMEAVAAGFNGLVSFVGNLNEYLGQALPDDLWNLIADIILQQGDLQLFNTLQSLPQQ